PPPGSPHRGGKRGRRPRPARPLRGAVTGGIRPARRRAAVRRPASGGHPHGRTLRPSSYAPSSETRVSPPPDAPRRGFHGAAPRTPGPRRARPPPPGAARRPRRRGDAGPVRGPLPARGAFGSPIGRAAAGGAEGPP